MRKMMFLKRGLVVLLTTTMLLGNSVVPVKAAEPEDANAEVTDSEDYEDDSGSEADDIDEEEGSILTAGSFAGGSGTEADPYRIEDYSQLLLIGAQTAEGLHYKLTRYLSK